LVAAGIVEAGGATFAKVRFEWTCPLADVRLGLHGRLKLVQTADGGVCATAASELFVNPLEFLNAQTAPVAPPGLDGRTNLVGPADHDRARLLALQLRTVAGIIDSFLGAIAAAAGSEVDARLTLYQVELNRDVVREGAPQLAHALRAESNPWHRVGRARHYAAHPDTETRANYVTVTWPNDAKDVPTRMKFYAKTAELLRTELCYDKPASVALALNGGARAAANPSAADGAGLAELLRRLALASLPLLDAMRAHVAALAGPQAEVLDLIVALAPLLRVTAPPPPGRPGARPGPSTKQDARYALYCLLELGRCDASALPGDGTVRRALDKIVAEKGLLSEGLGRAALYTVPPGMSAARRSLARALWPAARVPGGPRMLLRRGGPPAVP
jgi:hypothetical protein